MAGSIIRKNGKQDQNTGSVHAVLIAAGRLPQAIKASDNIMAHNHRT
ncbi:MAG: hypothetical protein ACPGPS_12325 [Rubripirellula sp.]